MRGEGRKGFTRGCFFEIQEGEGETGLRSKDDREKVGEK